MSEFHVGGLSPERELRPWSEDRARAVLSGAEEHRHGVPVIKGAPSSPDARMNVYREGHVVIVRFLNDDVFPVLDFHFLSEEHNLHNQELGGGWPRPGMLLLANVTQTTYSGEVNRYGRPVPDELLQRLNRTDGTTRGSYNRALPGKDHQHYSGLDWFGESTFDIESDDYWEAPATFGDWERWFRDRPDVKLFG